MVEVALAAGEPPTSGVAVVLVGPEQLGDAAQRIDASAGGLLRKALAHERDVKHGRIIHLPFPTGTAFDAVVLLVAGKPAGLSALDLEELGGTLVERLTALRIVRAAVAATGGLDLGVAPAEAAARLGHGARLRGYEFDRYKSKAPEEEPRVRLESLVFHTDEPGHPLAARLLSLADAVAATRDLVSEPANVLTPRALADACAGLASYGIEVEVLDRAELERLGMRAILGVAQGSAQPPYVAVMRWRGADSPKPLALVGKGVCFDSGGLSIKPAGGMEEMKWDMGGAAAVFGAMRALAARHAAADVVGLVGLVENMPSGTAQRPGDVVRAMSGTTIEVINTDAEGRLLLADVLWYAQDRFKPAAMVDLATLTGACVVALGHEHAGLFSNDETLAQRLLAAGEATGETLWRLPLGKKYAKHIKSDIADIKNVGRAREAGASAGAVFLERFVNDVPWAHLDIAGTAWSSRDLPLVPKGATGYGVRLLDRLVADAYDRHADVTEIGFYHLTRSTPEQALPKLLEKVLASGQRAVVRAPEPGQLELIDRALWTYETDSFLPHGTRADGNVERQPILLTTDEERPNGASVLVLLAGAAFGDLSDYARCLDLFDGGAPEAVDNARERWRWAKAQGHGVVYWRQDDRGRWTKARDEEAERVTSATRGPPL